MENTVAAAKTAWNGEMCEVVLSRDIFHFIFFGYVNAPTANAEKRGFSSMHPKRVLVVDAFHWGHFAQGIKFFFILPPKPFSLGKLRLKVSVRLKHLTIFSYLEEIFWSETQKCYINLI